jgi:hypothetical protein
LVVCIAAYQFVAVYAGWYFPYDVVNGNPQTAVTQTIRPYFVGGERFGKVYAPFSEPSTLSQYLIGLFMGCVYLWTVRQGGIRVRVLAVLSGLTLLLTVSTTGYVGLVVGGGLVLATMLRRRRLRAGLCGVCAVLATVIVIAYYALISIGHGDADSVVQAVTSATLEKTTSGSFEARTFVDRASLNALIETYGLGVGWGSTRASSLAINVLACGGLCGAALLGWFAKGLTQNMARQKRCPHLEFVKFVLYGNLIGGFIAVPDVNGAFLWVLIGGLIGGAALRRPTDSYRVLDSRCLEAAQ